MMIGKILMGMVMKLATAEMLEWLVIEAAQFLANRTETKWDDKLVTKVRGLLDK